MKRGIEVWPDYDKAGIWRLNISKKRGKLSIDDIRDTAREYELDFYLLFMDCYNDEDPNPFGYEELAGDYVTLYRAEDAFKNLDLDCSL